jgi:uncharacterized protein (DUF1499 family)
MTQSRLGRISTWLGRLAVLSVIVGPTIAHFEIVAPIRGFAVFLVGVLFAALCLLLGILAFAMGPSGTRARTAGGMLPAVLVILTILAASGAGPGIPRINDITTDTANPPQFVHAGTLPENANRDMAYPGEGFARQQREGYGEIAGVTLASPPDDAFRRVASVARSMDGWVITREDAPARAVEGYETSRLFQFKDDFVVEVRPTDNGQSLVVMRSKSRDGQGDVGINAKRIRTFLGRLSN